MHGAVAPVPHACPARADCPVSEELGASAREWMMTGVLPSETRVLPHRSR